MLKYAKIINEETGLCEVGSGTNTQFYLSIGMTEQDVQQSDINNAWYLAAKCPMKTDEEKLSEVKNAKLDEALKKAYEYENSVGFVVYKNLKFETSTSNISKLTSQFAMIQAGIVESVQWVSKDDVQIELTQQDLIQLAKLIANHTSDLWNVHYLAYKQQIETATSFSDVENIVIDYSSCYLGTTDDAEKSEEISVQDCEA